jgi:hypothetical protein
LPYGQQCPTRHKEYAAYRPESMHHGVIKTKVVSLQRVMDAKARLFFRRFRGVSHVTGTLPKNGHLHF